MFERLEDAHSLPRSMTTFIGRGRDLAEISALLDDPNCRLLTLVGPGGIGKTRLALEVARQADFSEGVYFVPLQPLGDSEDIVMAIVEALPLQLTDHMEARQLLLNYLHDRHVLLVLDNIEHLLDGVEIITSILNNTNRAQLLITSRERLNLQAEQVWPLRGLDVPEAGLDAPALSSAVQLFDERARRVQPDFLLQDHWNAVVDICRVVEGMPLALELAASWVRALPCETIADEIQRNVDMLAGGQHDLPERHKNMRAVFDHSWKLLAKVERAAFCRLTVFHGGFTADAAQQVAGTSLRTLASLIDKSLVRLDDSGRYDMHELLCQYGDEQLEASDAGKDIRNRHSTYFADYVHRRVADLKGRRQLGATAEINADFENVRSAWHWATDCQCAEIIEQMIEGLWIYCKIRYKVQDALALYRYAEQQFAPQQGEEPQQLWGRLLARCVAPEDSQLQIETAREIAQRFKDPQEIAFCLTQNGHLAYANQEFDKAIQLFEQSLAIYRQLGDRYHIADVLFHRLVYDHQSDWNSVNHYRDEMMHLRREIGDRSGLGRSLAPAAINEGRLGHFAEAERLWLERVALGHETGNLALVASSHAHISHRVFFFQGDFAQARAAADEAIKIGNRIGIRTALGWALSTLGLLASMNKNYAEGRQLCQQAAAIDDFVDVGKYAAWGLAIAACGHGDYETAYSHLAEAFWYLTNILGLVGDIASLPVVAIIYAHQGQPVRAVELLALAFTHPVGASGWMEKWPLLDRLQADLEDQLGPEAYSKAWERGTHLNIDEVITELQAQFFTTVTPAPERANQALLDPISPRELEVLVLVAEGLTNREIAERLFIGVSTVKKHIQHIYSKLDTKHRTGAVARARKLNLIQ